MGNKRILIDTSVIINFLRSKEKSKTSFWKLINEYECCVSSVTVFELYAGATDRAKMNDINKILSFFKIIGFTNETAILASNIYKELRSKNKLIEFRDIFVAATAIKENISISTKNKKHFQRVKNLSILNY